MFLNPALDADAAVGSQVKACHVWHSPGDIGLRIAKLFPWSQWGSMGATGSVGDWPPWINYDKSGPAFEMKSFTHLDIFLPRVLDYFGPRIVDAVIAAA